MSSWRPLLLTVVLAAGGVLLVTQGLTSPAGIRQAVGGAGVAAPVVFVVVYAALTVLLVPGAVGSAAAGALFGAAWGSALVIIGASLGATAAFLLARSLGRARIERLTGPRIRRVDRWLTDRGLGAGLGDPGSTAFVASPALLAGLSLAGVLALRLIQPAESRGTAS